MQASLVPQIRARYPHPSTGDLGDPSADYCVGGACFLYLHAEGRTYFSTNRHFPTADELADLLVNENPALDDNELGIRLSSLYANEIVTKNDAESFGEAWRALEEALAYRHPHN